MTATDTTTTKQPAPAARLAQLAAELRKRGYQLVPTAGGVFIVARRAAPRGR